MANSPRPLVSPPEPDASVSFPSIQADHNLKHLGR
jgi:hypothetical protein